MSTTPSTPGGEPGSTPGGEPGSTPGGEPATPRATIEKLRRTLAEMSGAERRLRSRDHQRRGELSFTQLRSLAALGREREMTVGHLAKSAELKPATVTVMLDHLEAANIVQRTRSTEDRRVCNVSLTPAGWELLERKLAKWQRLWEEEFADTPDEELQTAMRVLGRVTALYESVAGPEDREDSAPPSSG